MSRRGNGVRNSRNRLCSFGPQLKFMEVGILLTYFAVSCSSLSEDSAEFRYVPLYIADQVEFRCCFCKNFTYKISHMKDYNSFSTTQKKK